MTKKSPSINLVNTDKNQLTNQITNWALTIGRVLIIIVEIIALSAFIYRFILDNELRELNSKIKLEQEILNSQQYKEVEYRNLQDRLSLASTIVNQGKDKTRMYKEIIALVPQGISLTNLSYLDNQINLQLNTGSVIPLSIFVNALKNYRLTDYISIDLIENKATAATINVGLTVSLKTQGGNK